MLAISKQLLSTLLLLATAVLYPHLAEAVVKQVLVTQVDAQWKMIEEVPKAKNDAAVLELTLHATTTPPNPKFLLNYTGASAQAVEKEVPSAKPTGSNTWTMTVPLADIDLTKDVVLTGKIEGKDVQGPTWKLAAATAPAGAPSYSLSLSALDEKALLWWNSQGSTDERKKLLKTETTIVHLPSGSPVEVPPSDLREPARVAIYVMVPKDGNQRARTELSVQSCPSVVPFRTTGEAKDFAGVLQGATFDFLLVPLGSQLKCGAGTLSYSIVVTNLTNPPSGAGDGAKKAVSQSESTTTNVSIRIRPVYHLLVAGFFGFDGAKKPSYSVQNSKIVMQEDSYGLDLGVGLVWAPLGVDYEEMKWYNYFLNPYIAFSFNNPTENFSVGLATTVTGGISLTVGASFHRITTLNGVSVGDSFTGSGEIPTQKTWSKDGMGFYIGLALDKNVFALLKGIVGK